MLSSMRGDYCELLVCAEFVKMGVAIALPFGNQAGWDLLAQSRTGWKRVQVKTANFGATPSENRSGKRPAWRVKCETGTGRPYAAGSFDFMVAVDASTGAMWLVDESRISGRSARRFALKRHEMGLSGWQMPAPCEVEQATPDCQTSFA